MKFATTWIFLSLVSLLFNHLFVGFHPTPHFILPLLEDGESHVVQVTPSLVIVHAQMRSHTFDYGQESLHTAIDVGGVGVGGGAENVRHFRFLVLFDEVPNLLVRAKGSDELAPLVLNLAILEWINLIFLCFRLLTRGL